jgi:NAD(P)-dependent dehydrogenase (short-subunit alcohol dehydrogenase family)
VESYRSLFDLADRVAVVTGGGGRLGTEIARGLGDFGARVVLADLDAARAQKASESIEGALAEYVDVTSRESAAALVERVIAQCGRLDVLVNSAGILKIAPATEMTVEEWEAVLRVNLTGTFLMTQAAGRVMLRQGRGNVVNIASVSSTVGNPEYAAYAASKGGVAQLTKVLGVEWCRRGVNVNAIGPAFTDTELTRPWVERMGGQPRVVERIPMGRPGEPRDIVGAAIFLASDAARFLVGQTLYVDGGRTL